MTLDWLKQRPIAHHGLHNKSKGIAENVLTAFYLAADQNFPIMLDGCLTKDGAVIVYHDHLSALSLEAKIIGCLARVLSDKKLVIAMVLFKARRMFLINFKVEHRY
ncbi:hypothetical protein [Bartonella sp. HY761]|uniref:hypothetical protein n=1 Tax=Bartonella sp. HY761 TaxID=2979330 RepID=UPI0021F9F449|nr:hypothetical protein [Bartonella sp. HY761]UXN07562.1 hypothetical protein N6A79_06135 [Bartonella sp. HY761]